MDLPTFITVISILIAVYALLPRATKLTITLKVIWIDKAILILFLIFLHYLLFSDMFERNGVPFEWHYFYYDITSNELAYWTMVVYLLFVLLRFLLFPIPKKNIDKLHSLIEELLPSSLSHAQLIHLIGSHLLRITEICNGKQWYSLTRGSADTKKTRLERILEDMTLEEIQSVADGKKEIYLPPELAMPLFQKTNIPFYRKSIRLLLDQPNEHETSIYPLLKEENISKLKSFVKMIISRAINILPNDEISKEKACEILKLVLTKQKFVRSIASLNPYFALKIYRLDMNVSHKFSDIFLTEILNHTDSILYTELQDSQNIDRYNNYSILEESRLLHFFFDDANNAKKFAIWMPIGEAAISDLENRGLNPESDEYNHPFQGSEDRGYWESKIFVATRIFDVMVRSAILQNINWHMWLYYLDNFVELMCKNFKSTYIEDNYFRESPTRYSLLIHEILYSMKQWVLMIENIDLKQYNMRIDIDDNGNPVISAMNALSASLFHIVHCDQMPERLRRSYVDISLDLLLKLKSNKDLTAYANRLIRVIIQGSGWDRADRIYADGILRAIVNRNNTSYDYDDVIWAITKIIYAFMHKWGAEALEGVISYENVDNTIVIYSDMMRYQIPLPEELL